MRGFPAEQAASEKAQVERQRGDGRLGAGLCVWHLAQGCPGAGGSGTGHAAPRASLMESRLLHDGHCFLWPLISPLLSSNHRALLTTPCPSTPVPCVQPQSLYLPLSLHLLSVVRLLRRCFPQLIHVLWTRTELPFRFFAPIALVCCAVIAT